MKGPHDNGSFSSTLLDQLADQFAAALQSSQERPNIDDFVVKVPEAQRAGWLVRLAKMEMEHRAATGQDYHVEDYLGHPAADAAVAYELVHLECRLRHGEGRPILHDDLMDRFPKLDAWRLANDNLDYLAESSPDLPSEVDSDGGSGDTSDGGVALPNDDPPTKIGRYDIEGLLGQGGFGRVFKGHDGNLERSVAIKMPHLQFVDGTDGVDKFMREAQNAAKLRHPGIVTVYDSGKCDHGGCYIVYELIVGSNLSQYLQQRTLGHRKSALLIAEVADALHHAHVNGMVHRDVKPDNILLDTEGRPHVADFGLALREEELSEQLHSLAGTPRYMSPEQVRGENHRLDARTDIFSLGVIFYKMLCGRHPFPAHTRDELFDQILYQEARPPRTIDDKIPRELERICLKAMAKRIADRYTTARDMAEELRLANSSDTVALPKDVPSATPTAPTGEETPTGPPVKIIPKGLRAFGPEDAEFYLDLLPGLRDRDGLPEIIRQWKMWIEQADEDAPYSVGLIWGPSGCGKSSLVRAGLLPRLAKQQVQTIYLEATRDETDARLLAQLGRVVPRLENSTDLVAAISDLRKGKAGLVTNKVLIVLDQLEQWLQAHTTDLLATPLVKAMRQADGVHVQFLLLVREDFPAAITRLFQALEVTLQEGENSSFTDLFDRKHAQQVLQQFGHAYNCLPRNAEEYSTEQKAFVNQVIEGLSQDNQIIPVRLSLTADFMKSRPWTPVALDAVGGTAGVGKAFFEEIFSPRTAGPEHRLFEKPARALLAALLPRASSDLKGQRRTCQELMAAAGLTKQPERFGRLLNILDRELRIVTVVEAESEEPGNSSEEQTAYQLTHDYLVPSLQEWLTEKKRETWRGRAELCLEERSAQWNRNRDARFLPTLREFTSIALGVRRRKTEQKAMMRAAFRHYGMRVATLTVIFLWLGGVVWFAMEEYNRSQAWRIVQSIFRAAPDEVKGLIEKELPGYRKWADAMFHEILNHPKASPKEKLRARISLLPVDDTQTERLQRALLNCSIDEFPVVLDSLRPHRQDIVEKLWPMFHDNKLAEKQRFRAGLALANYVPEADQWKNEDGDFLTQQLLQADFQNQSRLRKWLRPIAERLVLALQAVIFDQNVAPLDRERAAVALSEYYEVFATLPANEARSKSVRKLLASLAARLAPAKASETNRVTLGRQRAAAGAALMRLGDFDKAFAIFRVKEDPESLTQFVHGAKALGIKPATLLTALDKAKDVNVHFGLVLTLGSFAPQDISQPRRNQLLKKLETWYRTEPSAAVHGAVGWLLRHWGQDKVVQKVDQTPLKYDPSGKREWFVEAIAMEIPNPAVGDGTVKMRHIEYFTFIVFRPGTFLEGSPKEEAGRDQDEERHLVTLTRPFALSDREITRLQYWRFNQSKNNVGGLLELPKLGKKESAKQGVLWTQAVDYCNWLTTTAKKPKCQSYGPRVLHDDNAFDPDATGFRLPTEAEWEYACRAGTTTPYSFGSDASLLNQYGWFKNNHRQVPAQVGKQLKPNLWGLFDLHGNVEEWCFDRYVVFTKASRTDPYKPGFGQGTPIPRSLRGGSFLSRFPSCRSAARKSLNPLRSARSIGYRIAVTLPTE